MVIYSIISFSGNIYYIYMDTLSYGHLLAIMVIYRRYPSWNNHGTSGHLHLGPSRGSGRCEARAGAGCGSEYPGHLGYHGAVSRIPWVFSDAFGDFMVIFFAGISYGFWDFSWWLIFKISWVFMGLRWFNEWFYRWFDGDSKGFSGI